VIAVSSREGVAAIDGFRSGLGPRGRRLFTTESFGTIDMETGLYEFHRRAFTALNELSEEDRAKVLDCLTQLAGQPRDRWPSQQAKRLNGDPDLYLIRIDDSLRAIVRMSNDLTLNVLDLVRHETLESFANVGA
jgi:hypothetical protein